MLYNLLSGESGGGFNAGTIVPIIIIVVILVAFFVWNFISQKRKQKNFEETVHSIRPGNKVTTIGGVMGEVVEVNPDEGTFVLRTGTSDEANCSYMKFDMQAIYKTDAKPEEAPAQAAPEGEKAEEPFEETSGQADEQGEEAAAPEQKEEGDEQKTEEK